MSATGGVRLTAAAAEALWRAWTRDGDAAARDRLVLAYTPLVRYLAGRKLRELPGHCDVDDLASAGLVALLEAVDRFDPGHGASFEHYVWMRVQGAIVDELRRHDWASRSVRREQRRIERAYDAFVARRGAAPTRGDLAGALGLEPEELVGRLEDVQRAELVSLSSPVHGDEATVELCDTVVAPAGGHEPELALLRGERAGAVRRAIGRLDDRERRALVLVHVEGAGGAAAGEELGVTESRISQILAGVRRKLGAELAAYDAAADAVAA
jgi:RNA polymerase sigma factor for flagellar operon FliA